MQLTYETGTATLIQFIVLGLLNIGDALDSIITTCNHPGGDCVGNLLSSLIFYILITVWFGIILALGFGAQERRSKRLSQALILAELAVFAVASYNINLNVNYHNGVLSLVTSCIDVIFSIWIISLAYRLMKASGGRVVKQRNRRKTSSKK
jgi:preprotein translocase subunit SecG